MTISRVPKEAAAAPRITVKSRLACNGFEKTTHPTFEVYHQSRKLGSMELPETIPWEKYCNRINYSACNENSASEIEALKPGPGKRILCITAGGGRVLDLLVTNPDEIWAIDLNIWQSYLLELKMAAMKSLDYEDYCVFIGDKASSNRLAIYRKMEESLSADARQFYDSRLYLIKKGILYQGNLERFFALTSRILGLVWAKNRARLFEFDDLEAQRKFLAKKWDKSIWKFFLKNFFRKSVIDVLADDPGFMRYLPKGLSVHKRIFECLDRYLRNNLARENHLLSMIFFGRYKYESSKPLYLQKECFYKIKSALDVTRIKIITARVIDVLKNCPAGTFDGFSFSDIASYMNDKAIEIHLDEIVRTARPGARIVARYCLAPRHFSPKHSKLIRRDGELERKLALHDYSMVHEFLTGEIS